MPFQVKDVVGLLLKPPRFAPTIKGWNRLEGRPRTADFARSLRAEVRDALWFLTRQWQFGEFQGEDAGSPVEMRTAVRCAPLTSYAVRGGAGVPYDRAVPLEVQVERETAPADLVTHVQISRAFFARLAGQPELAEIRDLYREDYPLTETSLAGAVDGRARQVLLLAQRHALDGVRLLAEIASGAHATRVAAFNALSAATKTKLVQVGSEVAIWFAQLYEQPRPGEPSAWAPSQLEYQFACAAEPPVIGAGQPASTVLVADRYASGRLDWHAFDVDATVERLRSGDGEGGASENPIDEVAPLSFLPAPVTFAGAPSHRYWEMENRRIEFADIDAQTTDVAKLLLTEFALIYGNDWCVIPHEVEVGSVCEVLGVIVTDTFGERSLVRAAGQGVDDDWQRWTMFTLSTNRADGRADTRLFVPPALPAMLEGPPVEKVLFVRDEIANLAWAVERVVPTALGEGGDGYAIARAAAGVPPPPSRHPTPAAVRYVLGTDVPENWRPFLPVHVPGSNRSIRLQRARMPGLGRPLRGQILNVPTPYYLNEEEVPRAGRIASRSVQRARWLGGRTFTWIGRRVVTGRGEASSGLAFDQVQPVDSADRVL